MTSHGGLYRGVVMDNTSSVLIVQVPQLLGDARIAARPCLPPSWSGTLPAVNSLIWVAFEGGEVRFPVWLGVVT